MGEEKTVRLPEGIVGASMGEVERRIPVEEPPPLAPNAQLSVIGKRTPRIDGRLKVTGAAKYTADVRLPGMLYARVVRSPHPHAHVKSIDTGPAERYPGVRAVHVVDHLLGGAVLRDPSKEEPSRFPIVRYVGQPICAVAAITQEDADEAARLVKVEYEALPFVVDLDEARKAGAPLVFPGPADEKATAGGGGGAVGVPQTGNVRGPAKGGNVKTREEVERAFASADVVVEGTFRTQVQTHSPLETHGVVADWKPGELVVYASTQGTGTVRDEIAEVLGLKKTEVRVVTEFMGGGFGAKFGAGNFGVLAANLSKKAGAPVRLMLDRREQHTAVGNRPSSLQKLRLGASKEGKLVALQLEAFGTAGVGTGAGCGGPAKNMYPFEAGFTEEYDVFTHAGSAAAFRAPGHPQGCFALEQLVDELAEKLMIDPLALRDIIDFDNDPAMNVDSAPRKIERRLGAERVEWARRRHAPGSDPGPIKRGIGMAQSIWYRIVSLDASCEVRIGKDGSVELLSAVQDIGGGIRTALAQVVAEELGLRATDIVVRIGDTRYPSGVPSGGSTTTGSITPAARNAAYAAKRKLFEQIAPAFGVGADDLEATGGNIVVKGASAQADKPSKLPFRAAAARMRLEQVGALASRSDDYGGFARPSARRRGMGVGGYGGVQFAEVAVDTETGIVKVERVVAVHDCGRPINPMATESQINGGVLQGISYALYENRVLERLRGTMLNANLESYKIAGSRETPKIEVILLEEYHGRTSTDAGGIGEPSTVPTAAAIANAVYNATGARVRDLPMTPARVLEALANAKRKP